MTKLDYQEIVQIFISPGHDFKGRHGKARLRNETEQVESVECITGRGLVGDRFLDYKENFKGQITFFDFSVGEEIAHSLGIEKLDMSSFRRNVIVSGLDLNELIGKCFEISGVRFEGVEECTPCYWMDEALGKGAEELMKGRGGLRCRILCDGKLDVGRFKIREITPG